MSQFPLGTQNPLAQAVMNQAIAYIKQFVANNSLPVSDGNHILTLIEKCMPGIVSQLTAEHPVQVPFDAINRSIALLTNQIIRDQQQRSQQSFVQGYPTSGYGGVGGIDPLQSLSYDKERPVPSVSYVQTAAPVDVAPPVIPGKLELVYTENPIHIYSFNDDPSATQLSTKRVNGSNIVDIRAKGLIADETGEKYSYCSAVCYIPEPALCRVIDNFKATNDFSVIGKYILHLDYSRFILRSSGVRGTKSPINLDPLTSPDRNRLPVSTTIGKVIESIKEQSYVVANGIENILVREFNDRIERYLRVDANIDTILRVEYLDDIATFASMRNPAFNGITYHPKFESTVFKCFVESIGKIITNKTRFGCYNTCDILPDLVACPKFVMRANGLVERDIANQESFIDAVECGYTAFAHNGTVVYANFIPKNLEEDLKDHVVRIRNTSSPFDFLISSMWLDRDNAKTIVLQEEPGRELVIKNGVTLDGSVIIYKSSEDWSYGLK